MNRFQGKTAVIIGGTTGIGFDTAKLLVAEGGRVGVTGRAAEAVAVAKSELGAGNQAWVSDMARLSDIDALATQVKEAFGQLDLLFINGGVARFAPLAQMTEAQYDEMFDINLKGAFFSAQKLAPLIKKGGSIVLTTTVVNEKGMPGASVYSASKAGLRALARSLAADLMEQGVRVNAVSPGPIDTPIMAKMGLSAEQQKGFVAQMTQANPMKRFGTGHEVALAVLYLAVDATYSTGLELKVDGGAGSL